MHVVNQNLSDFGPLVISQFIYTFALELRKNIMVNDAAHAEIIKTFPETATFLIPQINTDIIIGITEQHLVV